MIVKFKGNLYVGPVIIFPHVLYVDTDLTTLC